MSHITLKTHRRRKHWKGLTVTASQPWTGLLQSTCNFSYILIAILSIVWVVTSEICLTWQQNKILIWFQMQIADGWVFFVAGVRLLHQWCHWTKLSSHHCLSGGKEILRATTHKNFKKFQCNKNYPKIISAVLQCCWLRNQPPPLAGTRFVDNMTTIVSFLSMSTLIKFLVSMLFHRWDISRG